MVFNSGPSNILHRPCSWLLCILFVCTGFGSCKKAIEAQQKNIVISAITTGHWYVESYIAASTDVTAEFTGYEYQFYESGAVDAIRSSVTKSGTWTYDLNNYTITASFGGTANDTLKRLNYTWKITDSYLDYVEAKTTTTAGDNFLHLRKK